ncbi:molybdate ABC transporter permease subunit [Thermovibrio sp.]
MTLDREAIFAIELSLKVSFLSTLLVLLIGLPIATALAFKEFKFKNLADALITLPLVFPPVVMGYILLLLFGRQGLIGELLYKLFKFTVVFNWKGALLASTVAALPIFVKGARSTLEGIDKKLIEVSYTLGKGKVETFLKVILPLSKQGLTASLILSFARALGEFGATLMVAGNIPMKTTTIPLEIYNAVSSGEFEKANFLTLITALFSLGVIYAVNKLTEKRVDKG